MTNRLGKHNYDKRLSYFVNIPSTIIELASYGAICIKFYDFLLQILPITSNEICFGNSILITMAYYGYVIE